MTKQDKKDIVITGRTVVRTVQVLTGLFLLWKLFQTMLGQQVLDTSTVVLLTGSLVGLEISLQGEKRRASDDKTGV